MNVHNMMEDLVTAEVNKLYEQIKRANSPWLTCDCQNCRLDTINYVLNRIPPKYVVSGRGVTHSSEIFQDHQLIADISAFAMDGARVINATKRPFHSLSRDDCSFKLDDSPCFNFQPFTGTILDGSTFEPLPDASISLKLNGNTVEMIDMTWANPVKTYKCTKGTFSFWAKPIPAAIAGTSQKFNFEVEAQAEGYETAINYYVISVTSEKSSNIKLDTACSIKFKDIILFKKEDSQEDFN